MSHDNLYSPVVKEQLIAALQETKKRFIEKQSPIIRKQLDKLLTITRKRFIKEQKSFKRLKKAKRRLIIEEEESLTLESPTAMDQSIVPPPPVPVIDLREREKKITYIDLTQPSPPPTSPKTLDEVVGKGRKLFEPKTPPLPPPEMSNDCRHFPPVKFSTKRHLPTAKTQIIRPMPIRPHPPPTYFEHTHQQEPRQHQPSQSQRPIWRPWRPRAQDYF